MMEVVILEDYAQNPIITSTVNHNVENKKIIMKIYILVKIVSEILYIISS